jgi:hypothetical protein
LCQRLIPEQRLNPAYLLLKVSVAHFFARYLTPELRLNPACLL